MNCKEKIIRLAVFGSLKKDFPLHDCLSTATFVEKGKVKGAMYLCGRYPHLYRPGVLEEKLYRQHEVEIYNIPNDSFEGIQRMEHGAGYETQEIEINKKLTKIFFTRDDGRYHERLPWITAYTLQTLKSL